MSFSVNNQLELLMWNIHFSNKSVFLRGKGGRFCGVRERGFSPSARRFPVLADHHQLPGILLRLSNASLPIPLVV